MPAKNRKITLLYSGLAAGVVVMLGLVTITPKESRTIAPVQGKQLNVPSFIAPNLPKTQYSLIYIAIFAGLIMGGCSVAMLLLCSKRQEELPKERQAYEIDLEKERRILGANAAGRVAVATSAAKMAAEAEIDIYTNDLLTRFEAVAEKSNWVGLPEPVKPTKASALAEVETQLQSLEAKSRQIDQSRLPQTNLSDSVEDSQKKTTKTPGERLLSDLASSDKSMLLTGSTGAGKSHTLSAWLESVYAQARAKKQVASIFILGSKNDSFCGLREAGRLTIFNPFNPEKSFKLIEDFHKNFSIRLAETTEEERKHLPPLRLILEDWSATVAILQEFHPKLWSRIALMLLHVITVGREYNVCILVLAQSLNLKALGMVEDANLRGNLAIVAQGLITKVFDIEIGEYKLKGDYSLVHLAIKNQYIVPDNEVRQTVLAALKHLEVESRAKQIPVFFTTLGGGNVGLLPHIEKAFIAFTAKEKNEPIEFDIRKFRQSLIQQEQGMAIQPMQTTAIERPEMTREEIVTSLNRLYKPDGDEPDCPADGGSEPEPSEATLEPLNQPQDKDSGEFDPTFTTLYLNRAQAVNLINRLRSELNQTQIIERLWECKKGGSEAWKKAYVQFKDLTKEEGNEN